MQQAGKQRRRVKRNLWIGAISVLVMAALLVVACIAALGSDAAEGDHKQLVRWAVVGFGAFAVFLVGVAWWLIRKARPPAARHLRLDLASAQVRRGQPVDVTLDVTRASRGDAKVELQLVCVEHYDVEQRVYNPNGADYDKRATRSAEIHRDTTHVDPGEGSRRVTFTVPPEGPFSYEGECISATWKVRALERRARRGDRASEAEVWVAP